MMKIKLILIYFFVLIIFTQNNLLAQSNYRPEIEKGSGSFNMSGGPGHSDDTISVFYYKPQNFNPQSKILIVVPGSGRDGDEYRDAWIEDAEKHNVLILSPMYPDDDYNFGQYHMGGLIYDMQIEGNVEHVHNSNEVILDEENFGYKVNRNKKEWIYHDFDRIFDLAVSITGSAQTTYDIFGHSAGGQILHRMVLFHPDSKADRILASNSGFYTLPDFNSILPFGLKNTPIEKEEISNSFDQHLVLFIGEKDNENESGGTLLRSASADQQGLHRLARSKYFYQYGKEMANSIGEDFNWKLEIIPGIGHDFNQMSKAAAEYLY